LKLKLLACSFAIAACSLFAQRPSGPLTNQKIGNLAGAGVSDAEIIRIIGSAKDVNFDLRPGSTDNLLNAGVSEDVIKAMAAKVNGEAVPAAPRFSSSQAPVVQAANVSDRVPVADIGVYYRAVSGPWIQLMPELANWKTGGVLKSVGTVGIVKSDFNGRINSAGSRTHLNSTMEILVHCPEGTEITEYQLLKLRKHSNSREFRTVTGGVFHRSGGSNRDLISFDPKSVAPRSYTFALSGLSNGQYALMPPGSYESHGPSAQLGKVYTFSISE
jgi:hypothetical protein